jgi:hypothetical protein
VLHHIGDAKSSDDIYSLQKEISSFAESAGTTSVTADIRDPDAGQR